MLGYASTSIGVALLLLYVYVRLNDKRLKDIPERILSLSKHRVSPKDVKLLAERMSVNQTTNEEALSAQLPPKTGRRYIVVGGGGFVGGWIVVQLLRRGEDPRSIRVLDINHPVNHEVAEAQSRGLQCILVDISNGHAVEGAFTSPWNDDAPADTAVTVSHTASNIRFWERHPRFLPASAKVNILGTENILKVSKLIGAEILVYTSSASVGVHFTRTLLWPWETEEAKGFVQILDDDDSRLPKTHVESWSNYAVTKLAAEKLVRSADNSLTSGRDNRRLRTGAIRPGNGIFGSRGDALMGVCLVRKINPTWILQSLQSCIYVENCALAHLLYERRLLDLIEQNSRSSSKFNSDNKLPDIGGQAFVVADPGPPQTYGDAAVVLSTLDPACKWYSLSPTVMFVLACLVEGYYVTQFVLTRTFPWLSKVIPRLTGDIVQLQPSMFSLTCTHLIADDSRARLSPMQGGLGYKGAWTTLEGLYKTWKEYESGVSMSQVRVEEFNKKPWAGMDPFPLFPVVSPIVEVSPAE